MDEVKVIDKESLRKTQAVGTMFQTIFGSNFSDNWNFNQAEIKLMMMDSDICTALNQRKRAVNSRIFKITGDKPEALQKQFDDMAKRNIIDVIFNSQFTCYTVQEIIYNADLTMNSLKEKPSEWYMQMYMDSVRGYEWQFVYNGIYNTAGQGLPLAKFLIPINRPTDLFISGRSELEPIYKWWKIKEDALTYAQQIVAKYGGLIWWFLHNSNASTAEVTEMVDAIRALTAESVMAIPEKPGGTLQGLNHEFGFIPTSEYEIESVHMALIKFCKEQISQYLMGSSVSMTAGASGSYSSANAGIELLDTIVESDVEYCEYWLDWLIYYQSLIFGFDAKQYHVKLIEKENVKKTEETKSLKLDNYKKIKEVGYNVSMEYLSQELGIPIEALEVAPAAVSFNQPALQFAKKKNIDDLKAKDIQIDEELQKVILKINGKVSGQLAEEYKKAYSGMKLRSDFDNITVDYSKTEMDESLLLFKLFGMYTQLQPETIEFAEDLNYTISELFDLPFAEAVKYFGEKMPVMYDELDALIQESYDKVFWIKKATDLEVTSKVKSALDKSLAQGGTIRSFIDDIASTLEKAGIDKKGYYTELVFRNASMGSYNAGRYEQQQKTKEVYQYWMFNAIRDDRTSEICRNLDGKVFRANDPIWQRIYPGLHHGCRSVVTVLDEAMLYEYGIDTNINQEELNLGLTALEKSGFKSNSINQVETLKQVAESKVI
jgi:SPP1 gp7 family putative phage head morphogenesis protein